MRLICVGAKNIGRVRVAEFVGRLHLRQLHPAAAHRGRGIGALVIKDLLERVDLLGKPVTLDVLHGNRARLLYRRLGFREISQGVEKMQMIWRPGRR